MVTTTATNPPTATSHWFLRCDADDAAPSVRLEPPGPYRVGRRKECEIAVDEARASRDHALLEWAADGWRLRDLGSRHGTLLNGVMLPADRPVPLRHGDVLTIAGRTWHLCDGASGSQSRSVCLSRAAAEQADGSTISPLASASAVPDVQRWLRLLLSCLETLRLAEDEPALAEAVLDVAASAVGVRNLAFLRPLEGDDRTESYEVLAHRGNILDRAELRLSRTLLHRAAQGEPVCLSSRQGGSLAAAHSVVQLNIAEAVCVPLTLGPSVAAYLYLDHRGRADGSRRRHADLNFTAPDHAGSHGSASRPVLPSSTGSARLPDESYEFLVGLGRMASLAMADLRRRDLEKRQHFVDAELAAAGEAHGWILPPRVGACGPMRYVGECRPGPATVGGDFFDVVELPGGRICVALGDVSGKGVAASILMTATQGFLHASLRRHVDPAQAVADLNAYLAPRKRADRFVTLWVGVFDPQRGELTYVDAGHGLAILLDGHNAPKHLREDGGPLLGITPGAAYTSATERLAPGGRLLVVSDGLVEQRGGPQRREFGLDAVIDLIASRGEQSDVVGGSSPQEDEERPSVWTPKPRRVARAIDAQMIVSEKSL